MMKPQLITLLFTISTLTANLKSFSIEPESTDLSIYNYTFSWPTKASVKFTLGVVMSHPDIGEREIQSVLDEVFFSTKMSKASENSIFRPFFQIPLWRQLHVQLRLQINPINAYNMGLQRIIRTLLCSRSAENLNALLLLVDKSSYSNSQGIQLTNLLATLADHIGIPVIVWSSYTYGDMQGDMSPNVARTALDQAIHIAPSISSQAMAIYTFLKKYHEDKKICVLVSVRTPGYEVFVSKIREIGEVEDRRHSIFEFDSHQHHMSSRLVEIANVDQDFIDNLPVHITNLRDRSYARAFVIFANQRDTDKILEQAHNHGMIVDEYIWVVGKPSLGDLSEQTPIPVNFVPGIVAVTYDTSLAAQLSALKIGLKVWSESFSKFFQTRRFRGLRKAGHGLVHNSNFYYYFRAGADVKKLLDEQKGFLAPEISCGDSNQQKWNHRYSFIKALRRRLEKLKYFERVGDKILFLHLEINRKWKHIGAWSSVENEIAMEDEIWLKKLEKLKKFKEENFNFIRITTLEEPPYVNYEFPNEFGKCNEKGIPCRLSPLAEIETHHNSSEHSLRKHSHRSITDSNKINEKENGTVMCCTGFSMDILKRLSHDMGFSFELTEVKDRKWGAVNRVNGKWNGLVESLLNGSADMVMTSLKINSDRSSVIDFSIPFFETGITILVRVREGMVPANAFLKPFSKETWLVIFLGCVIAFSLVTFFIELVYHRFRAKIAYDETYRYTFAESFWAIMSLLFNATGSIKQPRSTTSRFITTLWSFICMILMASFMANLAAFMIIQDDFPDFSGVGDFRLKNPYTKNPAWRYSTIPHGATETIMRSNFPDMYEYMKPFMKPNVDEGVAAVKRGELDAFIYDASVLEYKVGRDNACQLRTVGKWYAFTGYGVALPKHSKWMNTINKYIVEYQRSGYLQQLENYWLGSACKERHKLDHQTSHTLGIPSFKNVFTILITSICGCAFFLLIEHIFMGYCRRYLRRIDRCNFFALISPKMGVVVSFPDTVEKLMKEQRSRLIKRSLSVVNSSAGIVIQVPRGKKADSTKTNRDIHSNLDGTLVKFR